MTSIPECAHILIGGRVQGVGFRYFVKQRAEMFNLAGHVCNLPDGNVEVLVVGMREILDDFIISLKTGPPGSVVINCQVDWRPLPLPTNEFSIKY